MRRARAVATTGLLLLASCRGDPAGPGAAGSRPTFSITSPARAAMLQGGTLDPSIVNVAGEVCDPSDNIVSLTLNGAAIAVGGDSRCESFSVDVPSRWGLTTITGEARNSRGRTTHLARSFLRGPAYFPSADAADVAARVPRGIAAHLTQAALDLGVAEIGRLYMNAISWDAAFPVGEVWDEVPSVPYVYDCFGVGVPSRTTGHWMRRYPGAGRRVFESNPAVRPSAHPGNRLDFIIRMALAIPMQVNATRDLGCLGYEATGTLDGWVGTDTVEFALSALLGIQHLGGGRDTVRASAISRAIGYPGARYFDFEFPAGFPTDPYRTIALARFGASVEAVADNTLINQLVPALEQLMSGLVPLTPAAVPSPGLLPAIVARPDSISSGSGLMSVASAVQLHPSAVRSGPAPSRGALRSDGALPGPATLQGSQLGTALKDDVINQFFWSEWRRGAFDGSGALVPLCQGAVPGAAFSSFAHLPPVLMPGTGNKVTIGLGDLMVSGTVDAATVGRTGAPISIELYASGAMTGAFSMGAPDALTITYDPVAELALEIAAISDSTALDAIGDALAPYVDCVLRSLTRDAIGRVPLPAFRPPNVPGLPATPWRPGSPIVERVGSYTVVRGTAP